MKLQRTTLILLVSAVLLGGFVYVHDVMRNPKQEAAKTTKQPIFSFKEDQIQSMTIYVDDQSLEFEQANGQLTNWRMKTPKDVPASDAAVDFLLKLLVDGKSDRSFTASANQLQEYGFDKPLATVKVQLKNQATHRLILGKPDFNRSAIYAQVDPPSQPPGSKLTVLLVPIDFEYAVKRPLSEWQLKQETPPSPKPSPTSENPQPSATSSTPTPSPTTESSKPSPTTENPKPSATSSTSTPSPTTGSSKLSPTTESPKPSASPSSAKSSLGTETPKPSPTQEKK